MQIGSDTSRSSSTKEDLTKNRPNTKERGVTKNRYVVGYIFTPLSYYLR